MAKQAYGIKTKNLVTKRKNSMNPMKNLRPVLVFENQFNKETKRLERTAKTWGYFHQWGTSLLETAEGNYSYDTAIVELTDGTVEKVDPTYIQFLDVAIDSFLKKKINDELEKVRGKESQQ